MQTLSQNGAAYRTKRLTQNHAEQFASCLRGNDQFTNVEVVEEPRCKSENEKRYYVSYQPTDPSHAEALLQGHEDQRRVQAEVEGEQYLFVENPDGNRFFWCQSVSGEVYEVTLHGCNCPDAEFRCGPSGIRCKHSRALEKAQEGGVVLTF